jgi:branched-chain amino acid transport system permease protein
MSWGRTLVALMVSVSAVAAYPFLAPNPYFLHVVIVGCTFAILAASWDLLYGYAGQLSFGHAAFFGIGGYTSALLALHLNISPWLGLVLGGLAASTYGTVVAVPALRLRGTYLALATLAFAEVGRVVSVNWSSLTRGTLGLTGYTTYAGLPFDRTVDHYVIVVGLAALCTGIMYWVAEHTRTGLIFKAIRDDEFRAEALGVNVLANKVLVFALSSFFAGVAGAFYAHYLRVITPGQLSPTITIFAIAMAVIGGIGTIIGPAVAGLVIEAVFEYLRSLGVVYHLVAMGIVLVLFVIHLPRGLAGLPRAVRTGLARLGNLPSEVPGPPRLEEAEPAPAQPEPVPEGPRDRPASGAVLADREIAHDTEEV